MDSLLDALLKELSDSNDNSTIMILREMCEKIFKQESSKLEETDETQIKIKNFWKYLQSFPTMLLSLKIKSIDESEILFLSIEMEGVEDFVVSIYEMREGKEEGKEIRARRIRTLTAFNDNNPKRIMSRYLSYYKNLK